MKNGKFFTSNICGTIMPFEWLKPITKFAYELLVNSELYEYRGFNSSMECFVYSLWKFELNEGLPKYLFAFKESRNKRK